MVCVCVLCMVSIPWPLSFNHSQPHSWSRGLKSPQVWKTQLGHWNISSCSEFYFSCLWFRILMLNYTKKSQRSPSGSNHRCLLHFLDLKTHCVHCITSSTFHFLQGLHFSSHFGSESLTPLLSSFYILSILFFIPHLFFAFCVFSH